MDNQDFQNGTNEQNVQTEQNVQQTVNMGDINAQKGMAVLTHILGIVTGFVGPLILYFVSEDKPWVKEHSKNALNFQITLLIAYVAGMILSVVCIGVLIMLAAWVLAVIFGIMGAMKANKGEMYSYPMTIKFIK